MSKEISLELYRGHVIIIRTKTGYRLRAGHFNILIKSGQPVRFVNSHTGEQLKLAQYLDGKRFTEFRAEDIFGTGKPAGKTIVEWLKSLWGKNHYYSAEAWVRRTVPLDVLLGFGGPRPGVTADPVTGWHWSCEMTGTGNPKYYESNAAYKQSRTEAA